MIGNVRLIARLPLFPVSRRTSSNGNAGVSDAQPFVPCTYIKDDKTAPYDALPCTTRPFGNCMRNEIPSSTSQNVTVSRVQLCALTSAGSSSTSQRVVFTQYTPKSISGPPPARVESTSHGSDLPGTNNSLNAV